MLKSRLKATTKQPKIVHTGLFFTHAFQSSGFYSLHSKIIAYYENLFLVTLIKIFKLINEHKRKLFRLFIVYCKEYLTL